MKIRVEYVAQIRDAAGCPGEVLDLPAGSAIQDAVRAVARARGERLATMLLDAGGNLTAGALLFLGDDQVEWSEARPLRDGDTVTLMSPLAGG